MKTFVLQNKEKGTKYKQNYNFNIIKFCIGQQKMPQFHNLVLLTGPIAQPRWPNAPL